MAEAASHGVRFYRKDGSGGSVASGDELVAEVLSNNVPKEMLGSIDVTCHRSSAPKKIPGALFSFEDLTLEMAYDTAQTSITGLRTRFRNRNTDRWQLSIPKSGVATPSHNTGTQMAFNGFIDEHGLTAENDPEQAVRLAIKVVITGDITFTA